jgi:hypothetical protein
MHLVTAVIMSVTSFIDYLEDASNEFSFISTASYFEVRYVKLLPASGLFGSENLFHLTAENLI